MLKTVIKRDRREVPADLRKITSAIQKAFLEVDGGISERAITLADTIASEISELGERMSVEEIQDEVEVRLMRRSRPDVAKAYILYREKRKKEREKQAALRAKVWEKTQAQNTQNANANVDERSFGGRKQEASSVIQREIALDYILSPEVAAAHNGGLIYEHDLDSTAVGMHNCLNIDFQTLLTQGFSTRNGDVRPPSNFQTACQQVAVIFQCQSQVQFGGVGAVHLDYDLAPFVKKSFQKHFRDGLQWVERGAELPPDEEVSLDNTALREEHPEAFRFASEMLEREGRQAAEALYHNLNTLESRAGSQVPFTSINFGRDASTEGRLVTRWMLEASLSGIGKFHRTSIFPISIFQYKKGTNALPGDPNYDLKQLAIQSLSKRIYPNFANGDWSEAHEDAENPDTFFSTMGCRTLIGYDRHGLGYTRVGRGNNVPVTIILPKLGIEYGICLGKRSAPDLDGFERALEDTLQLTERALLERFDHMCRQHAASAPFMYENGTIKDSAACGENVYNALKHNTLAIGYIGVAEMCQALFGKNHVHDKAVHAFALRVVQRIARFAAEASARNNLNFSCYATPAEGLCSTALQNLKAQYGVIENVTSRDYLTNSHHVPVWEEVSIYEKLRIEAPFCKYPTGGCITYIECESTFMQNRKAIEDIIDYAFEELDIPYLAVNFPIDSCLACGHQGEFNDRCPECGSEDILQLRRVTGYLTTDRRNFNAGKQAEERDRVKHSAFTTSPEG